MVVVVVVVLRLYGPFGPYDCPYHVPLMVLVCRNDRNDLSFSLSDRYRVYKYRDNDHN